MSASFTLSTLPRFALLLALGASLPARAAVTRTGSHSETVHATIQDALDAAQPGDTLRIAPGVYHENVVFRRSGTPSAPITLTGPGAIIDGAAADYQQTPAGRWERLERDGHVYYRTALPFADEATPGAAIGTWISRFGTPGTNRSDRLIAAYATPDALLDPAPRGEGSFRDRDHVHVKLAGNEDPNTVPLSIGRALAVIDTGGHSHLRITDLEVRNGGWTGIYLAAADGAPDAQFAGGTADLDELPPPAESPAWRDVEIARVTVRNSFRGISTGTGVGFDVRIREVRILNGVVDSWPWSGGYRSGMGQSEVNNSDTLAPWRGFGLRLIHLRDSEVSGSLVSGQWDGLGIKRSRRVRIHHNTFRHIMDDGVELESPEQADITFSNNHIHDAFAGISVTSNGPGPIHIYRNVVEVTRPGASSGRSASYGVKSGHDSLGLARNIKFYHNTFYSQGFSVWEKLGDPLPNRWHGYDFVNNVFYSFGSRPQNVNFRGAGATDTGGDNHWEANLYNHDRPADEPAALTVPDLADRFVDAGQPAGPGPRDLRLRAGSPGCGDGSDYPSRQGWPDSVTDFPGGRDRGAWQAGMAADDIGAPLPVLNVSPSP
ncbi:hypothetical protein OPIT5_08055 [Opitutaceae bacterium TAV5]|nr:hypothetical protein OPIT5_08055 [Opitutaceae bacterium TAV5]